MLQTKYQCSRPYGFRQVDFSIFSPIITYVKHVIPGAGPFFVQGHNLDKLARGPLDHATYQIPGSKSYGFREDFFPCFPYVNICITCDPKGQDNLWPQVDNLNKLGRGPLGNATNQILRP